MAFPPVIGSSACDEVELVAFGVKETDPAVVVLGQ
jgi:hypothetical protein